MRRSILLPLLVLVAAGCDDAADTSTSTSSSGASTSATTTTSSATTTTTSSSGSGTGGGGGTGGAGPSTPVTINFAAAVGGEAFDCTKTFDNVGSPASTIQLTDFRFYVHDVRLIGANDSETPVTLDQDGKWQHENLALLDFENKTGTCSNGTVDTHTVITGTVPPGVYGGLAFKLGVPAALNHLDAGVAPSPLNLTGLFWSWTDGYKYARIDSTVTGAAGPFLLHLGAGGCTEDPQTKVVTCAQPNIAEYRFLSFAPATQKVVFDFGLLLKDNDMSKNSGGAPGCMSGKTDPECVTLFPRLGLDIATGMPGATSQQFAHVE
jgi:uncharacterized repeat protein (TIGR04052 family)